MLTRAPEDCPDQPAYVEIEFDTGVPVRVNGIEMSLLEMIESLETIGGTHGVGRTDTLVDPSGRRERREIDEAPAAVVLHIAHKALEELVMAATRAVCNGIEVRRAYADADRVGRWFSETREALDAFVGRDPAEGHRFRSLRLFKGDCRVVERAVRRRADATDAQCSGCTAHSTAPVAVPGSTSRTFTSRGTSLVRTVRG